MGSLGAALIQALREAGEDPADLVENRVAAGYGRDG